MQININKEIVLCCNTICNNYTGVVAEYNFLTKEENVVDIYNKYYADKYDSYEEFIDLYDPLEEGLHIYNICSNKGDIMYEDWNSVDWDMEDLQDQIDNM